MTTTITPLSTPPSREEPNTFRPRTDTLLSELPVMVTEINVVSGEINALAVSAAESEAAAISAKNAAIAISGATVYSGVATYDYPDDAVIGSDGNTYRCMGVGVTGDDPVGSITGNWHAITPVTVDFLSFENLFLMGA